MQITYAEHKLYSYMPLAIIIIITGPIILDILLEYIDHFHSQTI